MDALNIFNHSNFQGFNANDVTSALGFAATSAGIPKANFFTCGTAAGACARPNGTLVGTNGRALHLSDLQNGKVSSNLLAPIFGFPGSIGGIGDPATDDGQRLFQLSFHVRF